METKQKIMEQIKHKNNNNNSIAIINIVYTHNKQTTEKNHRRHQHINQFLWFRTKNILKKRKKKEIAEHVRAFNYTFVQHTYKEYRKTEN